MKRKTTPKKKSVKKKLAWCVYILECENGFLYTGITGDLDRRFKQHKSGNGGKFTRTFGATKILYFEKSADRSQALKREFQIKSWPREKKLALINPELCVSTQKRKKMKREIQVKSKSTS